MGGGYFGLQGVTPKIRTMNGGGMLNVAALDYLLVNNRVNLMSDVSVGDVASCLGNEKLSPKEKPLCVDLDGTLVQTDTLIESFFSLISSHQAFRLPHFLASNRAAFKSKLSKVVDLKPALLPYNLPLLNYLREQKSCGRKLVLATAADERIANAIADYLQIFDEVIASNGVVNLKGKLKAKELVRRFGRKGFDYAGNSRADLPVWREADKIIIVSATNSVAKAAQRLADPVAEYPQETSRSLAMLRAVRPYQWVKNLLVFVPLLTAQAFSDWAGIGAALIAFASLCATASGIYILNDLLDLDADRNHPRKCRRPFASGAVPLAYGRCYR